jgi:phosphate starvation-inducible protein PhoH/intein/homing endonuclease
MKRVALPEQAAETLFGNRDENLRFLEDNLKVRIKNDGSTLLVEGEGEGEDVVVQLFDQLGSMIKDGYAASPGDVRVAAQLLSQDPGARLRDFLMKAAIRGAKKVVVPRSLNQRAYLEELEKNDMVFGIGPAGTGKCVAADSLVLTSEGMVEIGQLVSGTAKGQAVAVSLGIHGLDGRETATLVYDGGESDTLRIHTRLGYSIEATPEHPLLVLDANGQLDWRRADHLRIGDVVALQRGQRLFGDQVGVSWKTARNPHDHTSKPVRIEALDAELSYVLGLIVGDGCLSFRNRVILSSVDADAVAAFKGLAARFGLHVFPNTGPCDYVIASSQLSGLFAHLGLSLGTARTKRIPRTILAAPEAIVAAFLSGLFDADGTVDRRDGTITFSTVSLTLARQVQTVLLNFGIVAARGVKRGRYQGRRHISQRLTITGVDARRFDERIGFRLERKRSRRRWAPFNTNVDVVPFIAPAIRAAMRTATLTHSQHKAFGDYRIGRRRPSYDTLGRLVALLYDGGAHPAALEPLQDLVDHRLLFLEVARIRSSRAHVFDLTVPGSHSFVANGFVNHNTYLAVAQAVSSLLAKSVARIVLARPAVEAGEKLGFLPGDLQDKVDPYLRPLYDALYDLLDYDRVSRLLERNAIEVAPIAFMRGRTLNDAFVIIDEAQNTTTEQMKMVLTRIGFGSKVVITGDITQIDLPAGRTSGLVEAIAVLSGVKGISFVYFDEKDVVRHKLVQSVVKAYDAYGAAQAQAPAR